MEYVDQSKDFKASLMAHMEKISQCGCGGMGGEPVATVDDLNSKINSALTRLLKEWLLTIDESQLQQVGSVIEKLEQASAVELFEIMKQTGASNPFQVLGELFCNQAEVEELPEGTVEEINEEPVVVEMEKDDGLPTP
jgi:hypothetical protein